jgi:hypothetical protein
MARRRAILEEIIDYYEHNGLPRTIDPHVRKHNIKKVADYIKRQITPMNPEINKYSIPNGVKRRIIERIQKEIIGLDNILLYLYPSVEKELDRLLITENIDSTELEKSIDTNIELLRIWCRSIVVRLEFKEVKLSHISNYIEEVREKNKAMEKRIIDEELEKDLEKQLALLPDKIEREFKNKGIEKDFT